MSYFYLNQIITSTFPLNREYMIIPIIPIGGVLLYLKQNNLTYHSTGKNITGKILIKEKYERYIIA